VSLDLLRARVALRERSLADVLDLALRFVVVHARVYAKVAAVSLLPALTVTAAIAAWLGWGAAWLSVIVLLPACGIPFTVLASRAVFEDEVRAGEVLRASGRALFRVLAARLLALAAMLVGLVLFVFPGIWTGTSLFFLSEVMLLERASAGAAVGRSQRIASSAPGDTLLAALVLPLMLAMAVMLADVAGRAVIGELLQFRPPEPLLRAGGSVLGLVGAFAFVPYLATARFLTYVNVRTRTEGWDVQTRFAALAARAARDAAERA
jgi:hypothetical protein